MKRRELFWMLVPCLLLAGVGLWLRGREANVKPKRTDFRVTLEEVKVVPPTPREVALGYDTVVFVKTVVEGPEKIDFRDSKFYNYPTGIEYQIQDAKGQRVEAATRGGHMNTEESRYSKTETQIFYFKLSKVPKKTGTLYFRVINHAYLYQVGTGKTLQHANSEPVKIPVRKAGETITAPPVSKERPFALLGQEVKWIPGPMGTKCEVIFLVDLVEALKSLATGGAVGVDNRTVVADGKVLSGSNSYSWSPGQNPLGISQYLTIPARARNVTYKASLSINGCWPLPVEVELRKNGKNVTHVKPKLD